jgi:glutaredoxin
MKFFKSFYLQDFQLKFGADSSFVHPMRLLSAGPYLPIPSQWKSIAVLCRADKEADGKRFMKNLSDGLHPHFPNGFNSIFRTNLSFELSTFREESAEEIASTFRESFGSSTFPVILLQKKNHEAYDSTYYEAKAKFMGMGLSSQVFTFENLNNPQTYEWSVFPTTIQMFAKMGGYPYVLDRSFVGEDKLPTSGLTLILMGLGLVYDPLTKRKAVGFATFYDERGRWLLVENDSTIMTGNRQHDSSSISSMLGKMINRAIKELSEFSGVSAKNIVIIVHYHGKEMSGSEIAIINDCLEQVSSTNVSFYVAKLKNSNLLLCDPHSPHTNKTGHETHVPPAGIVFKMNSHYLVNLTGYFPNTRPLASNVKIPVAPSSLFVSIDRLSEEDYLKDTDILASVYGLCRMSYSTVTNPLIRFPVTIKYSKEIAWLTLKTGGTTDPRLKHLPWFI